MRIFAVILFIFFTTGLFAQNEPSIFIPDTIEHIVYYKSGKVKTYDASIEGRPAIEYSLKRWYSRTGKTILYDSIDAANDILYIAVFRKDGSPYSVLSETKTNYKITLQNRNGNVSDIYSGKHNERLVLWEIYQNGTKTKDSIFDRFANTKLDTLSYYEKVISKGKKTILRQELSKGSKITLENHIRMVYSKDSVLLSEGLYNFRVKNCGYYIEYYPDGSFKNIGEFDKRGYKNNDWLYFDEAGNVTKRERFFRGTNIFK